MKAKRKVVFKTKVKLIVFERISHVLNKMVNKQMVRLTEIISRKMPRLFIKLSIMVVDCKIAT